MAYFPHSARVPFSLAPHNATATPQIRRAVNTIIHAVGPGVLRFCFRNGVDMELATVATLTVN
jgi:hypothetical protein